MSVPIFPPDGGSLSAYLLGTWEVNNEIATTIYLANPTCHLQTFVAVFFDMGGNPVKGIQGEIPHNGLRKLSASQYGRGEGAVKIVTFGPDGFPKNPQSGLVGYQRKTRRNRSGFIPGFRAQCYTETESPLFQIPYEVLMDKELGIILSAPM